MEKGEFRFGVTKSLAEMMEQDPRYNTKKAHDYIVEGIAFYRSEFMRVMKRHRSVDALYNMYLLLDDMMLKARGKAPLPIRCTKGCAHCCHVRVSISRMEAKLLIEFCQSKKIPIDKDYLLAQAMQPQQGYSTFAGNACVFLDKKDNTCKVYQVRPSNCRKYFVGTDPELCNTAVNPKGMVAILRSLDAEILASSLIEYDNKDMAAQLLSVMEEMNC